MSEASVFDYAQALEEKLHRLEARLVKLEAGPGVHCDSKPEVEKREG